MNPFTESSPQRTGLHESPNGNWVKMSLVMIDVTWGPEDLPRDYYGR